jgi:large subunit ribosomal protein L25
VTHGKKDPVVVSVAVVGGEEPTEAAAAGAEGAGAAAPAPEAKAAAPAKEAKAAPAKDAKKK